MKNRIRYTVERVNGNQFYQLPKFLFNDEFENLSNDARILYTLLKDRHELSIKNEWYNDKQEVYLIMRREEMESLLKLSAPTTRRVLKELKVANLIEEERQGLNKPNLIYLLECKDFTVRTVKKLHSGVQENYSQDCKEFTPNHTNPINHTNLSKTNSINQAKIANEVLNVPNLNNLMIDTIDINSIKNAIKEKIFLEHLKNKYPTRQNELQELYEIIVEVLTTKKKSLRIAKEEMAAATVKQAFEVLTFSHIEYVIECLSKNITEVKNTKAYLQTALYNASKTMNNYYTMSAQNIINDALGIIHE
jgi:hypothetical protein